MKQKLINLLKKGNVETFNRYRKFTKNKSVDLSNANLSNANLSNTNLSNANLSFVGLSSADLSFANLSRSNLAFADLSFAILTFANLRFADLSNSDLEDADLSMSDLENAKNIFIFNKLNGRTCYAVVHKKRIMIKAGCFWGSLNKFKNECIKVYDNDTTVNYRYQIEYLKTIENKLNKND